MAHISDDAALLKAFHDGLDVQGYRRRGVQWGPYVTLSALCAKSSS